MEISAALQAVRQLDGPLLVVSDSTYVVNCFRDGWHRGWLERGWLTSAKKPVANRDLWEPLVDLVVGRGDVAFTWVKGHSGHPMNDFVDGLAVAACRSGGA
jgi:ribonuclease HI